MITDIPAAAAGNADADSAPAGSRAASFAADLRDLPVFAGLVKERGWQGLHMPSGAETGAP